MTTTTTTSRSLLFFMLATIFTLSIKAQVGINTTSPGDGSMLDIDTADKGLLIPRINITNLNSIAPITGGSTESLLVYNTNTSIGKGFYYWDGSVWVGLNNSDDWKEGGNSGTSTGTNFIGTTDNVGLSFRTNNAERLEITNSGRIRINESGSNSNPVIAWDGDANTGIWRSNTDRLNLTAGGREFIELTENGNNSVLSINDSGAQTDFRIETDNQANMLFVDGTDNRVGINTNNPQTDFHVGGNSSVVRIESLSSANSAYNNGTDNSVVLVDSNGNLVLQARVDDFPTDASDTNTFFATPITLTDPEGDDTVAAIAYTETFTLTRETLVEVCFWTACNILDGSGNLIDDGQPRLYGGLAYLDDGSGGIAQDIIYSAGSYTNADTRGSSTITTGFFTIGGNGFVNLPAGTHTISLMIFASGGATSSGGDGYTVDFGVNFANRFQIVHHN